MRIARTVVIGLLMGALLPKLLLPSRLDRVARPSEWSIGQRAVATLDERFLNDGFDKVAVVHYRVEDVRGCPAERAPRCARHSGGPPAGGPPSSARVYDVDVSAYAWFGLPYARRTIHCAWAPPGEGRVAAPARLLPGMG
ncbi:MAG: hypothetical protein M4D85_05380 [Actinomycetota bacterium]|nr:hypothetical protein [Actinomycetota bacterium]